MNGFACQGGRVAAFRTNGAIVPIPSAGRCTLRTAPLLPGAFAIGIAESLCLSMNGVAQSSARDSSGCQDLSASTGSEVPQQPQVGRRKEPTL
jgi:hypothetical protein